MRVLLAEDEVTIAVTLRDALEDGRARGAARARHGRARWRCSRAATPDVVLTDIRMPGEGGMAVLRALGRARSRRAR